MAPAKKMDPKLAKMLSAGKKHWKEAKTIQEEKFGGSRAVAGKYVAILIAAELGVVAEKLVVKPQWEIVEGDCKGVKLYEDTLWLHTPGAQAFFANWLAQFDKDLEDLENIPDVLDDLVRSGTFAKLKVSERDDSEYMDCKSIGRAAAPDDYNGEEAEDAAEDEAAEGDELDDMTRAELKKFIADNALSVKVVKSMDDDDLREAIRAAMPEEEEEAAEEEEAEEAEEAEAETTDGEEVDLESMDAKSIRKLIEDEGLTKEIPNYKKMTKENLVKAVQELSDDEAEDEAEAEEAADYELTPAAFKRFCTNQGIEPKKADTKDSDTMIAFLANFEYPEADLKKGDQELLEGVGLAELIASE